MYNSKIICTKNDNKVDNVERNIFTYIYRVLGNALESSKASWHFVLIWILLPEKYFYFGLPHFENH
jgi:hypothetical protein